ncbi:MAG TPA: hypothetical protein VHC18_10140 [Amycolatopsis sp.]|nr:hypothetical protein [Amycolatopsis sp.]
MIANEFAAVRVSVVRRGRGLRLELVDLDSGASVTLDPLDLQSFCHADEEAQCGWLRTDVYLDSAGAGAR